MSFPHPFITIDQNYLRKPDLITQLVDTCRRSDLKILIPDGAFLEFAKSDCFVETSRLSLIELAPYRKSVVAGRKLSHLMADELSNCAPTDYLINSETTAYLRSILADLDNGKGAELQDIVNGPNWVLMEAALDDWCNHDKLKAMIVALHDAIKATMTPAQLKSLRKSPDEEMLKWMESDTLNAFVFQWPKRRGADETTAYRLTTSPSVNAGFISAVLGIAVYWIAYGGIEASKPTAVSGDLNDLEYIVFGSLTHSLASKDQRATSICTMVRHGFKTRGRFPALT